MRLNDLTEEDLLTIAEELAEHLAEVEGLLASRAPGLRARPEEEKEIRATTARLRAVNAELSRRAPGLYDLGEARS